MRSARPALVAFSLMLLAGCLQFESEDDGAVPDLDDLAPSFRPPVPVSKEWPGAEPVIAVTSDGTLFVEGVGRKDNGNVNKVWRSTDAGRTWTDVTPPALGQERSNDGFVAVGNRDTVYAANVFSLTFQVYRSDDRGTTWKTLNLPRIPALMHRHWIVPVGDATVHVAIEALPPSYGPRLFGVPVDGPDSANEGMWYTRSTDRGETWTNPVRIDPIVNFAGQGNLVVSEDGRRLYVPRYEEPRPVAEYQYADGKWYLLVSENGGQSWDRRDMFPLTSELSTAVPSLALDSDGVLYFAWTQELEGTSQLFYARSADGGRSWTGRKALGDGSATRAMPWLDARGPGDLGIMWYQADVRGIASQVDAPWYVDYARLKDSAEDTLRVASVRVTPDPIHQGNICAKGPACTAGQDRRLLDYPWLEFGPDGRAHLAFASTQWSQPSAFAVYAGEGEPPSMDG